MTDSEEKKVKRKRPLWRRLLRWFVILIVVLVVLRAILPIVLPWALDRVAAGYDLSLDYDELSLSLLAGEVELSGLVIAPREGGDPVLTLGWARIDLSVSELIGGDIEFERIDIDRLDASLVIGKDGEFEVARRFASEEEPEEEPVEEEKVEEEGGSAFRIDGLQFRHLTLHVRDESVTPPVDLVVSLGAGVQRLGYEGEQGRVRLHASAEGLLRSFDVVATLLPKEETLIGEVEVSAFGLRLAHIAPWLLAAGIRPVADEIDLRLGAKLEKNGTNTKLTLEDLKVREDGRTAAWLSEVVAAIDQPEDGALVVTELSVDVGSWRGELRPDGVFRTMGIDLLPVEGAAPPEPVEVAAADPGVLRIESIRIRRLRGEILDSTLTPPVTTALDAVSVEIDDLASDATEPGSIAAYLQLEGLADSILISGSISPLTDVKRFDLSFTVEGLTPASHEPYLKAAGIVPDFETGKIAFGVRGRQSTEEDGGQLVDLSIQDFRLDAGERSHGLRSARIASMKTAADGGSLSIESVQLRGLDLGARKDADGVLHVLGFSLLPPPPTEPATAADPASPSEPAPATRIDIEQILIADNRLSFRDETVDPPIDLAVENLVVETGKITLGARGDREPVNVRIECAAPGILDRLSLGGSITARDRTTELDLVLQGRGLRPDGIAPWTEGLEFTCDTADLQLGLKARITPIESGGMAAEIEVEDVWFHADEESVFELASLAVSDVRSRPEGTSVGRIDITGPTLPVRRDPEGALHLLGMRFAPDTGTPAPATAAPEPAVVSDAPPSRTEIGGFALTDFRIDFTDESEGPARHQAIVAGISTGKILAGGSSELSDLNVNLRVPGTDTHLAITGDVKAGAETLSATLAIAARGLKAGPLDAVLPPGLRIESKDGRFDAQLTARMEPHPDGGRKASVEVSGVGVRDGEGGVALVAIESIRAVIDRLDGKGGVIDVKELAVRGITGDVRLGTDGTTRIAGIALTPVESVPDDTTPRVEAPAGPRPAAGLRKRLPLVTIETLAFEVDRFTVLSETPGATPLVLEDTRLWNPKPIRLLGEDPGAHEPASLSLKASLRPLMEELSVHCRVVPFSDPRGADILLTVTGVNGPALTKAFPALAEKLDADRLIDGRLAARIKAELTTKLRGPLDFAFPREIGWSLDVEEFGIRNGIEGPPLLQFDHLNSRARLKKGSGDLHVTSVELAGLRGEVTKEAGGLRVLGILLKTPPAAEEPPGGDGAGADEPDTTPGPIVAVDSLYISDLEFRIYDESVSPAMDFPLIGLDFELRDFTTLGFTEKKPFQFQFVTRAAPIRLPSDPDEPARPPLDEIVVSGTLALKPERLGSIRASVVGLELSNLGGLVAASGIDLNDGVLDLGLKISFPGDGAMDIASDVAFRDLSLSEGPDGPIMSALSLPDFVSSIDAILLLLEDHTGTIDFAQDLHMDRDGIGIGQITAAAVTQLSLLISEAALKSPLKVMGSVAGIFGFGSDEPDAEDPVGIAFVPGDTNLTEESQATLDALIERMKDEDDLVLAVIHELGRADIAPVALRSNPSGEQCRSLAAYGRLRRRELLEGRAVVAEEARAALAAGITETATTARRRLRAIDREIGDLDRALDQVLAVLKPGSEKRRVRRMRKGCLMLGLMRMEEVWKRLLDARIPGVEKRVRFRRPRYRDPEEEGGGRVSIRPSRRIETD